jgi:hypothetical protein
MLIEMCCKCGFVHKDDRIKLGDKSYRAYKPHYHWHPDSGELVLDGVTLYATICVACCSHDTVQWLEFVEQKKLTPEKYRVAGSWNAPLPLHLVRMADEMYLAQTKYFSFR